MLARVRSRFSAESQVTTATAPILDSRSLEASLCRKADAATLHADFQAVGGFAAGVHDAAVHVAGAVAVVPEVVVAAAAAAGLRRARAAGGLGHHYVAQGEELAEQAGQDAVNAAVWVQVKPISAKS